MAVAHQSPPAFRHRLSNIQLYAGDDGQYLVIMYWPQMHSRLL